MTPARIVRMKTKARSSRRMSRIDCHHASVASADRLATAGDVTASSPAKRRGTPAAAWRGWYTAVRSPEGAPYVRARSAFGLDHDRHFRRHAGIDLHRDLVRAERLERLLEIDLVTVDLDPTSRQRVRDVLRRDRAVELAALADLHAHRERRRTDPRRRDLGLFTFLLALVLTTGDVVLPRPVRAAGRRDGQRLGDQVVRGVAVGDLLEFAALAELRDVPGQDDLQVVGSSLLIHARVRGTTPDRSMARPVAEMRPGTRRMVRRTGPGVKRRIWAMSRSKATRSMARSSSFSWRSSGGTPSRKTSTARTTTTRSSSPPMIGIVSGMRSRPSARYPAAAPSTTLRSAGIRSSMTRAPMSRA